MRSLSARLSGFALLVYAVLIPALSMGQATFYDADIVSPTQPPRLVNDFGNMLPEQGIQMLEAKLRAYHDSTSTQIAIVTVPGLGNYPVEEYGIRLARKWQIGQKDKDNGILILLAKEERKIDIQTGYGIGQYVSDIDANRIIRELMIPHFKTGDFYTGLDLATDRMIFLLGGGFVADQQEQDIPVLAIVIILIAMIVFIGLITKAASKSDQHTFSGRGHHIPPTYWGGGMGGGGFGRSSGSFGGSGGFGGFGGGGFGGGGASGGW